MTSRGRGIQLVDAITRGDTKAIEELLSRTNVDLNVEIRGDNAIHMAARTGKLRLIKKLKRRGDDLQKGNINGNTPLHYAARDGYMDIVEYLHQNQVDMNKENNEGSTPLHLAVAQQTMDVIEELIRKFNMDPNCRNKWLFRFKREGKVPIVYIHRSSNGIILEIRTEGQTPLHTAVLYSRQDSIEALVICGADLNICDNGGKKAADIAKFKHIRDTLKIYAAMKSAMDEGFIQAKGLKITPALVSSPQIIERVGIILESIDLPVTFPTAFYCRREKSENTTVAFETFEDEKIFSDIFHIKVSDVNRDCKARIYLPLYVAASDNEEIVLRFKNCADEDHVADERIERDGVNYCLLETLLVPETTCICVVNIRPKKEETKVSTDAQVITSDIDKSFTIDIPAGAFEGLTILSLQVYESSQEKEMFDSDVESGDDDWPNSKGMTTADEHDKDIGNTSTNTLDSQSIETFKSKEMTTADEHDKDTANTSTYNLESQSIEPLRSIDGEEVDNKDNQTQERESSFLTTNVFQINVFGEQPNKSIVMQIPLKDKENFEDLVIVTADEKMLHKEDGLEILEKPPKIENANLIFEVSHFCLYFGTFRNHTLKKEDLMKLQRQISACKEQRQSVTFFAMVKKVVGSADLHSVVVECCKSSKFSKRRKKWEKKGYRFHETKEKCEEEIIPDDEFYVDLQGNTELTGDLDALHRKIKYSGIRSSYKYYEVSLKPDATEGTAKVCILTKSFGTDFDTIVELPIILELPPPPPRTPRPKTNRREQGYYPNKDEARKIYPSCKTS